LDNPADSKLCFRERREAEFNTGLICHFSVAISDYLYYLKLLASRLLPQKFFRLNVDSILTLTLSLADHSACHLLSRWYLDRLIRP
jgi:hypothetical protein